MAKNNQTRKTFFKCVKIFRDKKKSLMNSMSIAVYSKESLTFLYISSHHTYVTCRYCILQSQLMLHWQYRYTKLMPHLLSNSLFASDFFSSLQQYSICDTSTNWQCVVICNEMQFSRLETVFKEKKKFSFRL